MHTMTRPVIAPGNSSTGVAADTAACRHPACLRRAVGEGLCRDHLDVEIRWRKGGYVDAGPVRRHLRALLDAGVSLRAVHGLSTVDHQALAHLVVGMPETGTWPQGRIPAVAARRILEIAVPAPDPSAAAAEVPATGTVRRLQALVALGHAPESLAAQLNVTEQYVRLVLDATSPTVAADTARRVVAVFDELQMTLGDSQEARAEARKQNWDPPLAWDEHTIDNPAAQPEDSARFARFDERYLDLYSLQLSNEQIAAHMNITLQSLGRQLLRYKMSKRYGTLTRQRLS
jgi:hypothetical protein